MGKAMSRDVDEALAAAELPRLWLFLGGHKTRGHAPGGVCHLYAASETDSPNVLPN